MSWSRSVAAVGCLPGLARSTRPEAVEHFSAYKEEHRRTWVFLRPLLVRLTGRPGQSDEAIFAAIPLVELDLNV